MRLSSSAESAFALIGRILMAVLFVPQGWEKIPGFADTVGYVSSAGVPLPEVAAVIAIVAELGLGLMILVGWQTRWAALGLALYTLVISFIFHNYWSAPASEAFMQKINFFKNIGIVGGLSYLVAWGPGAWSLEGKRELPQQGPS